MKGCRPLTNEEIHQVLKVLPSQRERTLLVLGIKSAYRISELLSLRVSDVYQHGMIVDQIYVNRKNLKNKIEGRSVVLHPEAKLELEKLIENLKVDLDFNQETFLFKSRKGNNKPISRVQAWRILKRAFADCKLTGRTGCHSMRKTFADRIYDKLGKDLFRTKLALGHRNINSTCSYLSFKEEEVNDAILSV